MQKVQVELVGSLGEVELVAESEEGFFVHGIVLLVSSRAKGRGKVVSTSRFRRGFS